MKFLCTIITTHAQKEFCPLVLVGTSFFSPLILLQLCMCFINPSYLPFQFSFSNPIITSSNALAIFSTPWLTMPQTFPSPPLQSHGVQASIHFFSFSSFNTSHIIPISSHLVPHSTVHLFIAPSQCPGMLMNSLNVTRPATCPPVLLHTTQAHKSFQRLSAMITSILLCSHPLLSFSIQSLVHSLPACVLHLCN